MTAAKPQLLDWLAAQAEHGDLTGLGKSKVRWAFRAVHPDLRSRNGYRYPWPGHWAKAPGPILPHGDSCPNAEGDGLCIAKTFHGASMGGIRFGTFLLVGYTARDVLGEDDHKVRVRKMYVADVLSIATILSGADLSRADLSGAYLSGADLSGADLSGADLSGANLSRADLSGADLSRANLTRAILSRADLYGADLSRANLSRADLSRAYLYGANLSGAYLSRAILSGADLSRAYLSGADLSGANLTRAILSRANLSRADLSRANLYGANYSQLTLWPAGFDAKAAGAVLR